MLYLISYDLKDPGQNYQKLQSAIKGLGISWCHLLESTWVINTAFDARYITNYLRRNMDTNDFLFVVEISKKDRNGFLPQEAWHWLDQYDI